MTGKENIGEKKTNQVNEVTLEDDSLLQDLWSEARAHPALSRFDERELLSSLFIM